MQQPPAADRVLILRLGALGDVVRTLPAAAAIRTLYPGAHLTWLVEPGAAGVVEAAGVVDEVLVFPRGRLVEALAEGDGLGLWREVRRFVETLRERRFDLTLDFHGLLKTGLLARLSGAPIRIGYAAPTGREGSALFATHRVGPLPVAISRFERNAALVRALSCRARWPEAPLLSPSPLAEARLTARLRAAGRERSRDFVLIHPGSSRGAQHKRYPAAGWAAVARALAADGHEVWIATGPNRHERSLTEDIVRRADGALHLAPETRSFDDLLALQSRAAVFLAADSGPLHAASLAGVPVVQVLGPTHPIQNAPWPHATSEAIRAPLPCSPCRKGCADPACLRALPPAAIVEAALRHVARGSVPLRDLTGGGPSA